MGKKARRTPFRFNLPRGNNSAKAKRRQQVLPSVDVASLVALVHTQKPIQPSFYAAEHISPLKLGLRKAEPQELDLSGFRVINLATLADEIGCLCMHASTCHHAVALAKTGKNPIKLLGEGRRYGLASFLHARCLGCFHRFTFATSPRIGSGKCGKFEINVRSVWGEMVSGGGAAKLNELLGTMGVPGMTDKTFSKIEEEVGFLWKGVLDAELQKNATHERELAVARGDFHEGVPAITVIVDGGWSKRTHRHTYNALGGVAVIIGAASKKLLDIGVRNKYCSLCVHSDNMKKPAPQHKCFRNWNKSSQSMEADIILNAFNTCEEKYGLRYLRVVGDGDSSVYASLVTQGPYWCRGLKKLECANHACKCLRSNLEKLCAEHPEMKGRHGLTQQKRMHLVAYIRYAIAQRSQSSQGDPSEAAKRLRKDVVTSLSHVFGHHDSCDETVCRSKTCPPQPTEVDLEAEELQDREDEDIDVVITKQATYWMEVTSSQSLEAASSYNAKQTGIPQVLTREVCPLLNRVANKAVALLSNSTTNICESWMSIRAKFDGGKQINRCQRGSWAARCYGAALRSSLGPMWAPRVWKEITQDDPDVPFLSVYNRRWKSLALSKASKVREDVKRRARKRKRSRQLESGSKHAKMSYGPDAEQLQVEADLSTCKLEHECGVYYAKNVVVTEETAAAIELKTRDQSSSGDWHVERRHRLTSSSFKSVTARKSTSSPVPLIHRLLYSTFQGNMYTEYGLHQEGQTVVEYKEMMAKQGTPVIVESSGLVVNPLFPFLACSPDGNVVEEFSGSRGLVEVKNLLYKKNLTLDEAAKKLKSFCLRREGTKLSLKRRHTYYFQCQGQLAITGRAWVDFVVRCTNPHGLHVERIWKDDNVWLHEMLPKLKSFYFESYLPELSVPRKGKLPGIRDIQRGLNSTLYEALDNNESGPSTSCAEKQPSNEKPVRPKAKRRKAGRIPGFVKKNIRHQWKDESSDSLVWYTGRVTRLLRGRAGSSTAVYEIKYDGESDSFEVDHLIEDYLEGSVEIL